MCDTGIWSLREPRPRGCGDGGGVPTSEEQPHRGPPKPQLGDFRVAAERSNALRPVAPSVRHRHLEQGVCQERGHAGDLVEGQPGWGR